jgi:hypothetical protein
MLLVRTSVRPSPIHGLGLFAAEAIARGTPIWRFQPGFDREFSPDQLATLPAAAREHIQWFGFVRPTDGRVVLSGDHACFMNHSPAPNTGALPAAAPAVETIALRDVAVGEELTCDYFAFDASAGARPGLTPPPAARATG